MLQSLWENVIADESKKQTQSLTEQVYKAATCVRVINEKANMDHEDLELAVSMLEKAKRSLAALDTLPEGEDKRKHVKRVEDNIEKIHSFVNRLVQKQVDEENEELDAFDIDAYFDNKGKMEDPCSCNDGEPMSYENEEVGVVYKDPEDCFVVIRGRAGRYKAIGKNEYKGMIEPMAFDSEDEAIEHAYTSCATVEDEELHSRAQMAATDGYDMEDEECSRMSYEDEEGVFKDKYSGRVNEFRKTKDGHREYRQHIKGRPSKWKRTTKDWAATIQKDSHRVEDEEAMTLAPDYMQRKAAALDDPFGTGYARADDDHLSYQGGKDAEYDMRYKNDPELTRDYGDEFDQDDIMMRGDRDHDHDADASFTDELTDEEGGEWMDVADPETMDDDYHENEEVSNNIAMRKLKKKMYKRAGMENEESMYDKRQRKLKARHDHKYSKSEDEECGMENEEDSVAKRLQDHAKRIRSMDYRARYTKVRESDDQDELRPTFLEFISKE